MPPSSSTLSHTFVTLLDEHAVRHRLRTLIDEADREGVDVKVARPAANTEVHEFRELGTTVRYSYVWSRTGAGTQVRHTVEFPSRGLRARALRRFAGDGFGIEQIEEDFHPDRPPGGWTSATRPEPEHRTAAIDEAVRAPRAIDAPGIAEIVHRRRTIVILLLVAMAVAVAVVAAAFWRISVLSGRLEDRGIRTTATVREIDDADGESYWAEYELGGHTHRVYVEFPYERRAVGDVVALLAYPADGLARVDGEELSGTDVASLPLDVAILFAGVTAIALGIVAGWFGRRLRRQRRALEDHRFVAIEITGARVDDRGALYVRARGPAEPIVARSNPLLLGGARRRDALDPATLRRVLTVGDPETARLAAIGPRSLRSIARTRVALRRRLWQRGMVPLAHRSSDEGGRASLGSVGAHR